jgi:hypothetical protein
VRRREALGPPSVAKQPVPDPHTNHGRYALSDAYDMDRHVRDLLGMPILAGSSDMQLNHLAGLWRLPT